MECYDKFRNVGWQGFLAIYLKMVKWGDGFLCASKPFMTAWLLCLVGSSCPMIISKKCHSKVQYLGVLLILLKEDRLCDQLCIYIFNAARSVQRSGDVFRLIKSFSFKYSKMTDLLAQGVNFAILFAHIRVICKSNIIIKGGEGNLKCHMFIFFVFKYTCMSY